MNAAREDKILQQAQQIAERRLKQQEFITNPSVTKTLLLAAYRNVEQETLGVLLLTSQNGLLKRTDMFSGTIDGASVYPREIVKHALAHNAAAVILYHNHPSGIAEPSLQDRQITRRIGDALALVDIRLLDHMVIGKAEVVSFAERGLL